MDNRYSVHCGHSAHCTLCVYVQGVVNFEIIMAV